MIIIRAPSIFNIAWGLCKNVFPKGAVKKMVFSGPHNYLQVLEKYIDLDVLPPCIVPGGKGQVAVDMPIRLEGGIIPDGLCLDETIPEKEEVSVESTSLEDSASDSEATEVVISNVSICQSNVRCRRITHGCWVVAHTNETKIIRIFD